MELAVGLVQLTRVHVRINLGGGNIRVTQHFLDDAQIGSPAEQMCCEGMTQHVRVDCFFQSGALAEGDEQLPDALVG